MFFSPLFLSIPAAATAPVLILVGLMMLENITKVEFHDFSEAIPAFVCLIAMPMTYSISNGILLGIIAYAVVNLMCGKFKKLTPTICILAVLFVLKFMFMKPGENVENIPTNEIQFAFKSANVNVFKSTNVVKSNKKEQILAALNINDIEDADAEYSKYIVAEHIIKKNSIDKVSGFNVVDANISNENLPLYVANINKTTKYVIPIVRNQVYYGYISLNEDGKTLFGVYMPELNEESTTVEEAKEIVEETK